MNLTFQFYEEKRSRCGGPLPLPVIHDTKDLGNGQQMFKLSWGDGADGETDAEWLNADFFNQVNSGPTTTCNTQKERVRRLKNHSCGIFITASPCGIIVAFDEIFQSESNTQVFHILHILQL